MTFGNNMRKKTEDLSRTQLVGEIAALRGTLTSIYFSLRPRGNKNLEEVLKNYLNDKEEFNYLNQDLNHIETILEETIVDVSECDLVDGWFDKTWKDE